MIRLTSLTPYAVTNLTVTVDLTDQQSVANLSLVLVVRSDGDKITLVQNQNNAAGTPDTGVGLPGGNAIGQFGYAPGTPGTRGIPVGTIFDDNATRDHMMASGAVSYVLKDRPVSELMTAIRQAAGSSQGESVAS